METCNGGQFEESAGRFPTEDEAREEPVDFDRWTHWIREAVGQHSLNVTFGKRKEFERFKLGSSCIHFLALEEDGGDDDWREEEEERR